MALLISGLMLWSLVHLGPVLAPQLKPNCIGRMGENGYKLSFTIMIVASLVLIVMGWRSTVPSYLYYLPTVVRPVSLALIGLAFILLGASRYPTRIKHYVRHPQLTGLIAWSAGHLLINGDSRSVLLFGGLAAWAVLEMLLISKREGEWLKKPAPGWLQEAKGLAISLAVLVAAAYAHPYLSGVAII